MNGTPLWPRDDDLPRVVDFLPLSSAHGQLKLTVPADLHWYRGHFPGQPVLPGIVLVGWAIVFGETLWPVIRDVRGIGNLKFRKPVVPSAGEAVQLRLDLRLDARLGRLAFSYELDGNPCAQGVAYLP